ncbi:MAG: hypothetical protein OdinLCB4_000295 [Candidatus Odinarchaeum yellowstonii]|uniref:Uroporphyrinogen decarboxylase (URO-D) domain-containing protein n=1 Tax=Odinarchaeota yellowstonii (strain LCB_4) TaxID=1841599 RepID=A0AAF0D2D0_ODILC|nr:MAG: hypothetical protein OdinLCB4_000295 [Candidatus Odinarchaeum yellowstonii]
MRETVTLIFKGFKTDITPVQIEIGDPFLENVYSDIVTVSGRINRFEYFYVNGGPFSRFSNRLKWAKTININSYQWPSREELLEDFNRRVSAFKKLLKETTRFRIMKMLGPTELGEAFCAGKNVSKEFLAHGFDYSYLCLENIQAAENIHDKLTEYIVYILENSSLIEFFDAVRIADDVFDYHGYLYPVEFINRVWRRNHQRISSAIKSKGLYSILHTDGDPFREVDFIEENYNGVHPLDLAPKNSYSELGEWLKLIKRFITGRKFVFFTGLPINFLYGDEEKFKILKEFLIRDLTALKNYNFILSTTHRPYNTVDVQSENVKNRYKEIKKIRDLYFLRTAH